MDGRFPVPPGVSYTSQIRNGRPDARRRARFTFSRVPGPSPVLCPLFFVIEGFTVWANLFHGELLNWANIRCFFCDLIPCQDVRCRHPFPSFDRHRCPACTAGRLPFRRCGIAARQVASRGQTLPSMHDVRIRIRCAFGSAKNGVNTAANLQF